MITEPELKKRGDVYYLYWFKDGKPIWRSLRTTEKFLAQVRLVTMAEQIKQDAEEDRKLTVRAYSKLKLEEYKQTKSEWTYKKIKRTLDILNEVNGDKKLIDVRKEDMAKYIEKRRQIGSLNHRVKTLCNKTINDELVYIRMIFNEAVDEERLLRNPFRKIDKLKHVKPEKVVYSEEELRLIFRNLSVKQKKCCYFILLTATREEECTHLEWEDVDFKNEIVYFRPKQIVSADGEKSWTLKNNRPKVIPMYPELRLLLKGMKKTSNFVFVNRFNQPFTSLGSNFKEAVEKMGLRKDANLHLFRHTTPTYLLRRGKSLALVSKIMGHSDIRVTQESYGHLIATDLKPMMKEFGDHIAKEVLGEDLRNEIING